MAIDRTDKTERTARIDQLIEEFRAAQKRRRMRRAMKTWRDVEVKHQLAAFEAPPERVH